MSFHFGLVPRQYWRVPDEKFMIFIGYPVKDFYAQQEGMASLRVMPMGSTSLLKVEVQVAHEGQLETIRGRKTPEGHRE